MPKKTRLGAGFFRPRRLLAQLHLALFFIFFSRSCTAGHQIGVAPGRSLAGRQAVASDPPRSASSRKSLKSLQTLESRDLNKWSLPLLYAVAAGHVLVTEAPLSPGWSPLVTRLGSRIRSWSCRSTGCRERPAPVGLFRGSKACPIEGTLESRGLNKWSLA